MLEREIAYTLSPTCPFKITHAGGQEEHPDKGPHRHTHQQAHTPPTRGRKESPGSSYPLLSVFRYSWPPTPLSLKRVWGRLLRGTQPAEANLLRNDLKAV
jgi:hypothetical protein